MGKKSNAQKNLGSALIRDRFKGNRRQRDDETSVLHTTELDEDRWAKSVTEQGDLETFLTTAELAGTDFTAEKLNVHVALGPQNEAIISEERRKKMDAAVLEHGHLMRIPRRPAWTRDMPAEELQARERDTFLEWRRQLAVLQDQDDVVITPFERNLEFWRQLWRVIEKSDLVVQIVDARNPLLFHCPDLETYVKEVGAAKVNLLLINKADLLTPDLRRRWAAYLTAAGISFAFFSAQAEAEKQKLEEESLLETVVHNRRLKKPHVKRQPTFLEQKLQQKAAAAAEAADSALSDATAAPLKQSKATAAAAAALAGAVAAPRPSSSAKSAAAPLSSQDDDEDDDDDDEDDDDDDDDEEGEGDDDDAEFEDVDDDDDDDDDDGGEVIDEEMATTSPTAATAATAATAEEHIVHSSESLLDLFRELCVAQIKRGEQPVIGLVGYPNVGKSSTINALIKFKKVSVSQTPGKTKHFQTILLDDIILCDCPGLVFPSFANTKSEMVCNGILPIDQLRDPIGPATHVCYTIPRHVLEETYGIHIIKPSAEDPHPDRPPTAFELLNAYGYMRGFMNSSGRPDAQRSGRLLLKDYVAGKLLYCSPPPLPGQSVMESFRVRADATVALAATTRNVDMDSALLLGPRHMQTYGNAVDLQFFEKAVGKPITKAMNGAFVATGAAAAAAGLPTGKKHNNRNRKEKTRRLMKGMDMY